jgi:uncharacterized protein YqcC (DUF446 family)
MYQQTALLLKQIEAELRQLQLWSSVPPDSAALASTLPFCCDTLPFEQWLQFVFLPRMRALVEGRLPLPANSAISVMAEQSLAPISAEKLLLMQHLVDLDQLLCSTKGRQSAGF